jgi:uncharacterized protein (TIGR02145 family)
MNMGVGRKIFGGTCIWLFLPGLIWLILSCEREDLTPVVETTGISNIGLSSFTAMGTLVQADDEGVSQHGFCWSVAPAPALEGDSCIMLGPRFETGDFTSDIQGLDHNTTYYIRAYAVNGAGSAYGNEIVVMTDRTLTVPRVETSGVHTVTEYSAIAGGVVRDDGGSEIISYGVCWDTLPNPSTEGTHKTFSDGTGPFFTTIKNLELRTIYYIKAFAINSTGLAYGNEVEFRTNDYPVTDIDGNVYPTVVIGEQTWMARNLEVTRYPDGIPVPFTPEDEWWDSLRVDEKGFCYYDNLRSNRNTYGALYTWSAAVNGQDRLDPELEPIQGVCPDGWHLPSDGDWKELEMFLGMTVLTADSTGWRGNVGGKLKSAGREYWLIPNNGATNETRFTALPAGDRFPKSDYNNLHFSTFFWTSSNYNQNTAWARALGYYVTTMYRGHQDSKEFGFSVRCVRDD